MRLSDKGLVEKLSVARYFNQIFVQKSLKMDMLLSCFRAICFKPHVNLISINGNVKESLT